MQLQTFKDAGGCQAALHWPAACVGLAGGSQTCVAWGVGRQRRACALPGRHSLQRELARAVAPGPGPVAGVP